MHQERAFRWICLDREDIPVTFQIGVVASDGIILASDKKVVQVEDNISTCDSTQKITLSEDPPSMYCWAGDQTPGSVARAFVHLAKTAESIKVPWRADELLHQAAHQVWTAAYGPKYPLVPTQVTLGHKGGSLLMAVKEGTGLGLWRMDYGADFPFRPVYCKSSTGNNCAVYLLERYYTRDLTIKELLPVLAHCIAMGGHINPSGVSGLEIAICQPYCRTQQSPR